MPLKCVLPTLSDGEFSSNGAQKPCFNRRRLRITNTNISASKRVWGVWNSSSYFEMLHFYLLLSQAATTVYSELCLYESLRWGISECETRDEKEERERERDPTCGFESAHSGGCLEVVWSWIIQTLSRLWKSVKIFAPNFGVPPE